MVPPFVPEDARKTLANLLQENGTASDYIAAFQTVTGRHLALSRELKSVKIWLEAIPVEIAGVSIDREYQASDPRTSNLNAGRGARLAVGNPAFLVNVESDEALKSLVKWYTNLPALGGSGESMCLIGTWRDFNDQDLERVEKFISNHGGWASWWSFRIKDEAKSLLKTPFWLYVNRGNNSIVARYLVSDMKSDPAPIESPWTDQTEPQHIGKTREGSGTSEVFKTWFLVTEIERLPSILGSADFIPARGLSKESSLLNQSTFGYAYLKMKSHRKESVFHMPSNAPAVPLNTILYGPPGTSKTFKTIDYALKVIDPKHYADNAHDRGKLKERFDELRREGRIEFITFHQSYSYEDFVEGIRASTDEDRVVYQIEDGIFKKLCVRAASEGADAKFMSALEEFKNEIAEEPVDLRTKTGKAFSLTWRGGRTFRLRPHSSQVVGVDYPVSIENIERSYRGEDDSDFYNVSYVRAVRAHVTTKWSVPPYGGSKAKQPYVLIIDEINRGNISSIFGELITLIEPSKRADADEALSAILPYSKRESSPFTVPANLYVIGTMNTADRSLARVDTALRRRFDFVPMYPRAEELDGVLVEGIDIGRLLRAINDRIEILYDRDHLIGHALFMGIKEDPGKRTVEELAKVFRNNVLPLLEEYFFEDWQKIRLVLADNQTEIADYQFVTEDDLGGTNSLFGEAVASETIRYRRNEGALLRPDSYRKAYE